MVIEPPQLELEPFPDAVFGQFLRASIVSPLKYGVAVAKEITSAAALVTLA
jgi:hypothetical protein